MWKCHKCGKPVYFAERKQSLGYNWHPECLRCEECGKRLNPGQHAEHKGVPYCHVPCYGALFGPQLFGHGTRVESHKSFGPQKNLLTLGNGPSLPRSQLVTKIKSYNNFFEGKSGEIRSREVNGRLILEGPLRIHWGVQGVIHLKENDDQRTVVTVRKRNSCRYSYSNDFDSEDEVQSISRDTSFNDISVCSTDSNATDLGDISKADTGIDSGTDLPTDSASETSTAENSPVHTSISVDMPKSVTLPSKLDVKAMEWDELDDLLQIERKFDETDKMYQTMPEPFPSQSSFDSSSNSKSDSSSLTDTKSETPTLESPTEVNKENTPLLNDVDTTTTESVTIHNNKISKDDSWILNGNYLNRSMSGPDCLGKYRHLSPELDNEKSSITTDERGDDSQTDMSEYHDEEEVVVRRAAKTGSTAIRRRPGKRLSRSKVKRRCSINGHFYDRETSFFTPPHGSQMSVWITSLVNTQDVISLLLEKYKVESDPSNFALFMIRDNGEQRRLKEEESPLVARVMSGPHEDVAKLFLMDGLNTQEVSSEVAQFINLSLAECRAILNQYYTQEEKEVAQLKQKYFEMKRVMMFRMKDINSGL